MKRIVRISTDQNAAHLVVLIRDDPSNPFRPWSPCWMSTCAILLMGDKGTQNDDINRCKEFVAELRKKRESGETEQNEETTSDYE